MTLRNIYVDIDDVLAQTNARLVELLEQLHARFVDPGDVVHFDLGLSFGLDSDEVEAFMNHAHGDDIIESFSPIPGAVDVLSRWEAAGDRITLVTGRPPMTNAASRRWLDTHDVRYGDLHHLDKWNRPSWNADGLPSIRFEDLDEFGFAYAIEDSLDTAIRLIEEFDIPVALMDQPWNRDVHSISKKARSSLVRCETWAEIADFIGSS